MKQRVFNVRLILVVGFILLPLFALITTIQALSTTSLGIKGWLANASASFPYTSTYVPVKEMPYTLHSYPMSTFDSTRKRMYSTYPYRDIAVFDLNTGSVEGVIQNVYRPEKLLLSPDGSRLYISSNVNLGEDGRITVVDTQKLEIISSYVYTNSGQYSDRNVQSMAVGLSNELYIVAFNIGNNSLDRMDMSSGQIIATAPFTGWLMSLASHGNLLYAVERNISGKDGTLYKYDISTGMPVFETAVSIPEAGELTISPDGTTLLVHNDNNIFQFDTATLSLQRQYTTPEQYGFLSIAVSPDSQSFVGLYYPQGDYAGGLKVFDLATGQLRRQYFDIVNMGLAQGVATFSDELVGVVYGQYGFSGGGVRLLKPADHHIALPITYNRYCPVPSTDDFNDPTSGWPIEDTGRVIYRYIDGEYSIYHRNADQWTAVLSDDVWNKNKLYQLSGRVAQNYGMWGLLFGLNDDGTSFYTFEISPYHKEWYIFYYGDDVGWQLLARESRSIINSSTSFNTLAMKTWGGGIEFFINDQQVKDMRGLQGLVGRVGLTGGSFQKNVDIRYEDYIFVGETCPLPSPGANRPLGANRLLNLERPNLEEILSDGQPVNTFRIEE